MAFHIHFLQDVKEPLGFDHRLYCKVATEVEEEKQRNFTELATSESLVEKLCQGLLDDEMEDSGGAGEEGDQGAHPPDQRPCLRWDQGTLPDERCLD